MKNGKSSAVTTRASASRLVPKAPKRPSSTSNERSSSKAAPVVHQKAHETQSFGQLVPMPIGLSAKDCRVSVDLLNQLLADTITLRDLYKKHHWQVAGATFYSLHLLFDKHAGEQDALVDIIAERIQLLGGIALAMAADIAETTMIRRPPRGREEVPVQLSRLLEAHELIILATRAAARTTDKSDDMGTNDLLVSNVLRTNELQTWFLSEHLVETPLVRAD